MPRKAPEKVVEHRLTLGNYERTQLAELADAKKLQLGLSVLNSPIVAVAAVGGAGYLGLAYIFEWWPFDPLKSFTGWGMMDKKVYNKFDPVEINAYRDEQLATLDALNTKALEWIAANPSPEGMLNKMQNKMYHDVVNGYEAERTKIIETAAKAIVYANELRAKMEAKSDHV